MTAALRFPVHIPFADVLACQLVAMADGKAEVALDLRDALRNSFGVAPGGVLMSLLDIAMAHAVRSLHTDTPDFSPGAATIEMKTSFLRPATGPLRAHGVLLHRTAAMAFCEGRLLDAGGALCAHAIGTFKIVRALPARDGAGERRVHALQTAPGAPGARPDGSGTAGP